MLSGIFLLLAMENRPVAKVSLQVTATNQILTQQQMFAWAIAGIKYLYISEKDIAKNFQDFALEECHVRCKTIPGTRIDHSFIPISETVLEMKRLSVVVGNQFSFSKKHRANTTENILLLLTFQDYTYLIIKADL